MFGYLQTFFSFAQLIGGPLMGRFIDTNGAKKGLLITQVAAGLSYLLLGMAIDIPILFLSRVPTLLMHCMQAAQSAVTDLSDESTRVRICFLFVYLPAMKKNPIIFCLICKILEIL
jgi:OCT family organic cation transporter-like MFS transporter 18